jgi:hypothetical protein
MLNCESGHLITRDGKLRSVKLLALLQTTLADMHSYAFLMVDDRGNESVITCFNDGRQYKNIDSNNDLLPVTNG